MAAFTKVHLNGCKPARSAGCRATICHLIRGNGSDENMRKNHGDSLPVRFPVLNQHDGNSVKRDRWMPTFSQESQILLVEKALSKCNLVYFIGYLCLKLILIFFYTVFTFALLSPKYLLKYEY